MRPERPGTRPSWAVAGWLIRRRLRRRWVALLPLVLIVGLGGAGAFVALGVAERTAKAYSRYLERANVGDLVINPSPVTPEFDEAIHRLPGVQSVTSDAVFSASLDDGAPRPLVEIEFDPTGVVVVGSVDGRGAAMDRPALAEGRSAEGPREAAVSSEMADARGIEVGDVVPVSFWQVPDPLANTGDDTMVSPLGVEHLEVVGIGLLFPDTVLPDPLFPLQAMIVSPDVAADYGRLPEVPAADEGAENALSALYPESSATLFWDYSLKLADGDAGVAAVRDAMGRMAAELNAEHPQVVEADPSRAGHEVNITTSTAEVREQVERSVQPIVTALAVLGVAVAVVTAVVAGLTVARELRRTETDQLQWWQLGLSTVDRTGALAVPLVVALVVGLAIGLGLAWWVSPVGAVGTVRSVDPAPGRELASWVWLAALALTAVLVAVIVVQALRSARHLQQSRAHPITVPAVQRLIRGVGRPEVAEGIRAASGRRSSGLVIASGGVAGAALIAAVVFAASLSALVSTPRSYGWPWDLGVIGGLGWGGIDLDAVAATLAEREEVEGWTILGFNELLTLDGEPVFSMVGFDHSSPAGLTVLEGRLPVADGEIAIGSRTGRDRGISVGDEVALGVEGMDLGEATVTGRIVFPALGPLGGERTEPGAGVLVLSRMFDEDAQSGAGFVGIGLVPGTDPEAVRVRLRDDLPVWDTFFANPLTHVDPVRPPEIIEVQSMRGVPLLVGGLLGLAATVGLTYAVAASVRSRRRELAILRSLGFTGRQLRDSVRVQGVATMIAALVVGAPIGIAVGRLAWQAFASQLGVVTEPTVPGLWILVTALGALVVALAAAAIPARMAARAEPAAVLRSE